jgi:hypothetical protein
MKRAVFHQPFWMPVILAGLLVCFFFSGGGWLAYRNYLFADYGQLVVGKVVLKKITVTHGKGAHTDYSMLYQYQAGNMEVQRWAGVNSDTYHEYPAQAEIPIKYLPEKTTDSRIDNVSENGSQTASAVTILGIACVGLLILIIFGVFRFRSNTRVDQLLATGLTSMGRVTSLETEKMGKSTITYLVFEFTDSLGNVIEGRTGALNSKQQWYWEPKKQIKVTYYSRDPDTLTVDLEPSHYEGRPQIGTSERGAPWLGSVQ